MIRDLGDGLILRRARPGDEEALVDFHAAVHSDDGWDRPDAQTGAWVRDLFRRPPPAFEVDEFTLVEDTGHGAIVSSMCSIPQTWTYDGIAFAVGRPELVGTHPDYRRRGLVRAQFDELHGRGAERGEWVQAITGIPNYYRQFGYEMALHLQGGRLGYRPQVPELPEGENERFLLRPVQGADLRLIQRLDAAAGRRGRVACLRDEGLWRYEIWGRSALNVNRREFRIIETTAGEAVGFMAHGPWLWRGRISLSRYELDEGVSWLLVTPAVLRALWSAGEGYAERAGTSVREFVLGLGAEHPVYQVVLDGLPHVVPPYAWYLRVADVPGFLRHLAPALERRLAGSVAAGHWGELRLSFYRDGVRLVWEEGRLADVERWPPDRSEQAHAAFPGLTFLQLLFGYRSLAELKRAFPDCWSGGGEARVLLEVLFPPKGSDVRPIA